MHTKEMYQHTRTMTTRSHLMGVPNFDVVVALKVPTNVCSYIFFSISQIDP